ncbi:UNVERIFIED_CONTAM: CotS family spore coat protein [Brevibacillus sp. OAP136]
MLQDLLSTIASEYDLDIKRTKILRDREKSFLLKLHTAKGLFLLKRLSISEARQRFILAAEQYLRNQGLLIPRTLPTKSGRLYVMHAGYPYVITKWVEGESPPPNSSTRIKKAGRLLGRFHAKSRGFVFESGDRYARASSWEQEYASDLDRMEEWAITHADGSSTIENVIKKRLDFFLQAGRQAKKALDQSRFFQRWKKSALFSQYLCHGDFHTANIVSNKDGTYLIDWEDVRYDFPSKDLARFLHFIMRHDGRFSSRSWKQLLRAYQAKNRLSKQEKKLLYIDLSFPHGVERFLRTRGYEKMKVSEIKRFLRQERQKISYMKNQLKKL